MRVLPPGSECERRNPKKLKKVATSHFFDRLRAAKRPPFCNVNSLCLDVRFAVCRGNMRLANEEYKRDYGNDIRYHRNYIDRYGAA